MTTATLYVFSISHYCEKARWALEYLGVDYQLSTLMPGAHISVAKKLGLERGALPFLTCADTVVQGSSDIVAWAEQNSSNGRSLNSDSAEIQQVVMRLDDVLGVHVRRQYYSEALVEHSSMVRAVFLSGLGLLDKLKLRLAWPTIRERMIKAMDLGFEQGQESGLLVEQELNWLNQLLSSRTDFLVGDSLSLADITAASLMAPYVMPAQHPMAGVLTLPPKLAASINEWQGQPLWPWINSLYAEHR